MRVVSAAVVLFVVVGSCCGGPVHRNGEKSLVSESSEENEINTTHEEEGDQDQKPIVRELQHRFRRDTSPRLPKQLKLSTYFHRPFYHLSGNVRVNKRNQPRPIIRPEPVYNNNEEVTHSTPFESLQSHQNEISADLESVSQLGSADKEVEDEEVAAADSPVQSPSENKVKPAAATHEKKKTVKGVDSHIPASELESDEEEDDYDEEDDDDNELEDEQDDEEDQYDEPDSNEPDSNEIDDEDYY